MSNEYDDSIRAAVGNRPLIFLDTAFCNSADLVAELGIPTLAVLPRISQEPKNGKVNVIHMDDDAVGIEQADAQLHAVLNGAQKHVTRAINRFDPRQSAIIVAPSFSTLGTKAIGREIWGARSNAWRNFEDKVQADAIFDRAGVTHPPHQILKTDFAFSPASTFRALNKGDGLVLAPDATNGITGGGEDLRIIHSERELVSVLKSLERLGHKTARVAQFIHGIPMSIGGVCFPDGSVTVLSALENITFKVGSVPFAHYGVANKYQPPARVVASMNDAVKRTGEIMHTDAGYVGVFSIDGIVNRRGFHATEINSRFTHGSRNLGDSAPDIPFALLNAMLIAGKEVDFSFAQAVAEQAATNPYVEDMPLFAKRDITGENFSYRFINGQWQHGSTADSVPTVDRDGALIVMARNLQKMPGNDPVALVLMQLIQKIEQEHPGTLVQFTAPNITNTLELAPGRRTALALEI